jgi:hypothetical protein
MLEIISESSSNNTEIWVSNPIGNDFKISVNHLPRVGDHFGIKGKEFKVKGILFRPETYEYEQVNKCSILIALAARRT